MSIEKINYNIQPNRNHLPTKLENSYGKNIETYKKNNNQISFTASPSVPEIKKAIMGIMPPIFRGMQKLKSTIGEFQTIMINSIGTGLVAPIFIKYNPLSKTDEDTRTYSAWRQPVSAILAIMTQALITIPFDYIIKTMVNNGEFGLKYNSTFAPDEELVRKQLQIAHKHENLSNEQLNRLTKETLKKKYDALYNTLLTENKIKFSEHGKPNLTELPQGELRNLVVSTIQDELIAEQAELSKSYMVKTPLRIKRADFYRTNPTEALQLLEEVNSKLSIETNENAIKTFLKNKIKELQKAKAEPELITILEEIKDRHSYKDKKTGKETSLVEVMKKKVKGMLEDHSTYSKATSFEDIQTKINNEGLHRVKAIDGAIEVLKNAKNAILNNENMTIKELCELLKKDIQSRDANVAGRLEDFKLPKAIIEKLTAQVKSNTAALKQISGLIVSFAILPVTCSLLNWIYPRFMDVMFPNLSNKKHDTESSNLIERATKKAGIVS